jgi:VanZ family protein
LRAERIWNNQRLRWAAVLAWMGLIFFLSAQQHLPDLTPSAPGLEEIAGHLSVYFVLALLMRWALTGAGVRHATWWAIGFCALYGISDEFHQSFVPHRDPDIHDWVRDVLGASAAMILVWATTRLHARIRTRTGSR